MKGCCYLITFLLLSNITSAQLKYQRLQPVNFAQVSVTDSFWKPRIDKVATATMAACIEYTENKTGRIRNFEKAAKRNGGKHEGIYYDDSDVYKALEAMAYAIRTTGDKKLQAKAEEWIAKIAASQLPDGYLNTYYQLTGPENRWTDMEKHEDYCAGHLIEAAIAYENATGNKTLTNVAMKFADHIDTTFRIRNRPWVTGHQEIELALMKLYHHTQNKNYLELSNWFLEQRGHGHGKGEIWKWADGKEYCQDALPVRDQTEITGHAVRAMYLYCGAADVAAVTGDKGYMNAMKAIWEDVVFRNIYITGGIGGQARNEGFGQDYDLPNEDAYCETCASVGMTFWNHRMNMLTGETKYIDIMERSLYNGALDGLSLSGDRFFYGNPLASKGNHRRREWFGTACCPSNIARLVASLGNYIYAVSENAVWVNLFVGSTATMQAGGQPVGLQVATGYPWKGNVEITLSSSTKKNLGLYLRIPGWLNQPMPGGLYSYRNASTQGVKLTVNGKDEKFSVENGYAVISRKWKKGDKVQLELPMEVRVVESRPEVAANRDRVALQYGPLVYCVEAPDNDGGAWNFIVGRNPSFEVAHQPELLGGVNTIRFEGTVAEPKSDGATIGTGTRKITAIPYYTWCNRESSQMQVWLPMKFGNMVISD